MSLGDRFGSEFFWFVLLGGGVCFFLTMKVLHPEVEGEV